MLGGSWKGSMSMENIDISGGSVSNRSSLSDDDHLDHFPFRNMHDVPAKDLDFSFVGGVPRREDSHSPVSTMLVNNSISKINCNCLFCAVE